MLNAASAAPVVHRLYGIRIRTPWPIRGVAEFEDDWDVEFVADGTQHLARAAAFVPREQASWWAQYAALPDGGAYRRWTSLFEFLVTPDARRIYARLLSEVDHEAMLAYLLVDALSFSMVRLGREPLHGTAVLTDRGVVAFLGDSGAGKSTLAALFVARGAQLVTDDMLILTGDRERWLAEPGPPRLKLYRAMANVTLGSTPGSVRMNPETTKVIVPVSATTEACSLRTIYLLSSDDEHPCRPSFRQLTPGEALPRVLAHTAGHYPSDAVRLERQFTFVTALVQQIPVKALSYRRDTSAMSDVYDAVLADVANSVE